MKSEIEWFKVTDKLPIHSGFVLASHNGLIFQASYYAGKGWFEGYCDYAAKAEVTWWAYYPQLPKE